MIPFANKHLRVLLFGSFNYKLDCGQNLEGTRDWFEFLHFAIRQKGVVCFIRAVNDMPVGL